MIVLNVLVVASFRNLYAVLAINSYRWLITIYFTIATGFINLMVKTVNTDK